MSARYEAQPQYATDVGISTTSIISDTKISIDSCKIRIPFKEIDEIDNAVFANRYVVNAESGEHEDTFKNNAYKIDSQGIKTKIAIEKQITSDQKTEKFLVILFNSKLLKSSYFDGINQSNLHYVYLELMRFNVVKFSFDAFLNGELTDVDFKQDLIFESFCDAIKDIHQFAKCHKEINRGCNLFNAKTNKGIEFGKRNSASQYFPFLKFYHKGLELLHSSIEFNSTHLLGQENIDYNNLVRIETTIKNKKHFRKFGIDNTSLGSISSLSQNQLHMFFSDAYKIHLNERKIQMTKLVNELTPSDQIALNSIQMGMQLKMSFLAVRRALTHNLEKGTKAYQRAVKRLDRLYGDYIKNTKLDLHNAQLEAFYSQIGWNVE